MEKKDLRKDTHTHISCFKTNNVATRQKERSKGEINKTRLVPFVSKCHTKDWHVRLKPGFSDFQSIAFLWVRYISADNFMFVPSTVLFLLHLICFTFFFYFNCLRWSGKNTSEDLDQITWLCEVFFFQILF